MARRHTPEQVIAKVRQGQKVLNDGPPIVQVIKEFQVTEATWYHWRVRDHEAVLAGLEAVGYMEKVRVDNDGDVQWDTTIQGNALAMASFGKPISRKTAADRLVSGCWNVRTPTTPTPTSPCSSTHSGSSGATSTRKSIHSVTSTSNSTMTDGSLTKRFCRATPGQADDHSERTLTS
jgi:hypothetical protein